MSSHELKMAHEYTPIRFEVWRAENLEDLKKEFEALNFVVDNKECERCDGFGLLNCDLGHEHDCSDCDGTGRMEQTEAAALYDYSVNQYHEQIAKDKEKMKAYYAK